MAHVFNLIRETGNINTQAVVDFCPQRNDKRGVKEKEKIFYCFLIPPKFRSIVHAFLSRHQYLAPYPQ